MAIKERISIKGMDAEMSTDYNLNHSPDSGDTILKYKPMNLSIVNEILTKYKNNPVLDYIKDLYNLIDYQRKTIWQQRKEIVALKHQLVYQKCKEEDYELYRIGC